MTVLGSLDLRIRVSRIFITFIAMLFVLVASSSAASAVGNSAPDAGDFGAGNDVLLIVSQRKTSNTSTGGANGLDAPTSRVVIYSRIPNPTISIANPNQCKGGDPDTTNNPYSSLGLSYTTSFIFTWSGGSKRPTGSKDPGGGSGWGTNYIAQKGVGRCHEDNNTWSTAFNVPEAAAVDIDGVKYYVINLTSTIYTDVSHGSVNAFRVRTNSGIVSFSSTSGRKFALQDRRDDNGVEASTYHLYFALPCGADTRAKSLEWFDADRGEANQPSNIRYELWRKHRRLPGAEWERQSGPIYDLGGNNDSGSKDHTIHKDYVYDWRWLDVNKANGIQFEIPFNSIYALAACKDVVPISPSVSLTPVSLAAGDVVTAGAKLANNTGDTGRVTYTRQFWKSNDTGGFGAGDIALHAPVTQTVNVPPADLNLVPWTAVADGAYAYVCTALINITAVDTATVDTQVPSSTPPLCRPLVDVKYPAVQASNGDIRSGGSFAVNNSASCTLPTNTLASLRIRGHDYAASGLTKGSFGQYGVLAPGSITNTGSYGSYYQGDTSQSAKLLFGSRRGHSPTWPSDGLFYGAAATSTTASHCLKTPGGHVSSAPTMLGVSTSIPATGGYYSFGNVNNGTLTVGSATFGPGGGRHIIRVTQNDAPRSAAQLNKVVLSGNIIISDGPYATIAQLPQFILVIDKNIKLVVADSVNRIDGIISSRGSVFTCSGSASNGGFQGGNTGIKLTKSGTCSSSLVINGALILSGTLYPYRTFGYETASDTDVAELFNLRADALLGDYARSRATPTLRSVHQEELPPRF